VSEPNVQRTPSLTEQVHGELKRRILDGRLAPGSEVRDSVIAKSMGISRVPVRDACNLLVQSGLLWKQEHHPYRVREFSEADLGELQLIRWGYESVAVRHLVRAHVIPQGVKEPLDRMRVAGEDGDGDESGQADIDFHRALVRSTGLLELIRRHDSLMTQLSLSMRTLPAFVVPTQEYRHREILDVLQESQAATDPAPILRLMSTHLLTARSDVAENDQLRSKA
jgi:DNA-binding GntR family transcriptional regulator